MRDFTDAEFAIDEAEFLARESGEDYAIVALSDTLLRVIPLSCCKGMEALEIFKASTDRSCAQCEV